MAIYPVYTHPKKRGKKSKPTTEIQQRLNQRHTEGRLRRLLHTNFTDADLFATLTFDESVVCLSRKQVSDYLRISVNTADLETDAGVVYSNDDIKQYIEDKYGFKVHSAYIGQVREKLGIHQHENYNDSHTSPRKPTVCPAEKEAAIIDALKHFKLI